MSDENKKQTMSIFVTTKERLDEYKVHPRETYDECIARLLDEVNKE